MVTSSVENELDVSLLLHRLWRGKLWIAGLAVAGALLACGYAHWARQVWSATAIVDRPQVSEFVSYYNQRQQLAALEGDTVPGLSAATVRDEIYQEFLSQLSSWDSRRGFWLQSGYFQAQLRGNEEKSEVILNRLTSDIRFQPADTVRGTGDTLVLRADNAQASADLLRQYVQFASQRALSYLNGDLRAEWQARWQVAQAQLLRQQTSAEALYQRQTQQLQQALTNAGSADKPALQLRLDELLASGPAYDSDYLHNKILLASIKPVPVLTDNIRTWRYLRSPETPVSRESPRLLLLVVIWGMTGAFAGAVIAITRRTKK